VVVVVVAAAGFSIASRITEEVAITEASSVNSVDGAMFEVFFKVEDKLALPWNTDRIFFDWSLSKSGMMTAALSTTCPIPGIV
jgi:hypothetical protein